MNAKTKTQNSMSTESEPPRRRLALKKDTLKDLPARVARHVQGGRSSSGGSVVGSVAGSGVTQGQPGHGGELR